MLKTTNVLYSPITVVLLSVAISALIFLVIASILHIPFLSIGLLLSVAIPIPVSLPISFILINNYKKIKKQKLALEKLDATNKELFSLISHDIRSPISILKDMTEIFLEDGMEIEKQKAHLNQLTKKIDNVLKFLDDLIQWSRRQTENKPIEYSSFSCEEIISSVCEQLEILRKEKNITLKLGNLNNLVYTDKISYSFIIRNIYHNAIKFTQKNGEIEIYTTTKKGKTLTTIKDTGTGISKENLEEILNQDKWFSLKGTSNEIGTGFGIITCINYLKKNNGELLIESNLGIGTEITIILASQPL